MTEDSTLIDVRLAAKRPLAEDTGLFELVPTSGDLPAAQAGAHVDVHLGNGLVRQYSLVAADAQRYLLGVKREPAGRGGAKWLHDDVPIGSALRISAPRNHFPLRSEAAHSVLIAGGIGITPIWAMARQLIATGASWELHYGCRPRAHCAFHDELAALGDRVRLYFDDVQRPGAIDFAALAASAARKRGKAFVVELARSQKEVLVPPGRSILECLNEVGVRVPCSCTQGVCGSCETRVLAGVPLHRDVVLSDEERASNQAMMVCCSRAEGGRIRLDL